MLFRSEIRKIEQATLGKEESFLGKLVALDKRYIPKRRRQMLVGTLADGTGQLGLVWYRVPPYIGQSLAKGQMLLVHGKVERGIGVQKRIVHPEFEAIDPEDREDREKIVPIYLRPAGIALRTMRRWVGQALETHAAYLPSFLPASIAQKNSLVDIPQAMREVHQPDKTADLGSLNRFASAAHRTIIFDEFFYLQLGLALRRKCRAAQEGISFAAEKKSLTRKMWKLLPFALTGAQKKIGRAHV